MASKQSPAAKHHFWILFGLAPLFIFIAFLLMVITVNGAVAEAKGNFEKQLKDLGISPKSLTEVNAKAEEVKVLENGRQVLWSRNYQEQLDAGLFAWPDSTNAEFRSLANAKPPLKFGEGFSVVGLMMAPQTLRPAFDKAYRQLAEPDDTGKRDSIAPTRFAGGTYPTALRTVSNWGEKDIDRNDFWLALEDYWVQKGLLIPIARLNAAAALFEDVTPKDAADADLKRNFRNRTWELDLEVTKKGGKQTIQGQLRNRTPRLQLLGAAKAMKVRVWLKDAPPTEAADVTFEIRGESVPGNGSLACTPQTINVPSAARIARVIQVFDEATVPVRLVNTVAIGKLDHRNRAAALEMPSFIEADAAAAGTTPPTTGGGGGDDEDKKYGGGPQQSRPGGPGSGTAASGTAVTLASQLAPKRRYVKRTDDVRRMPVAVSVVLDNDYLTELMVAYTNSPLHFQITQAQWARFKGTLPGIAGDGGVADSGTVVGRGGGGRRGGGDDDEGEPAAASGAGGNRPPGYGSSSPPPGVVSPTAGGGASSPSGPVTPPRGGTPAASGGGTRLPDESSANLSELALYGVISLYEQLPAQEPKNPDDATKPPVVPPANPMGQPTTPADPMKPNQPTAPTDPMKKDEPADKPKDGGEPKPPADKPKDPSDKPKEPADKPKDPTPPQPPADKPKDGSDKPKDGSDKPKDGGEPKPPADKPKDPTLPQPPK